MCRHWKSWVKLGQSVFPPRRNVHDSGFDSRHSNMDTLVKILDIIIDLAWMVACTVYGVLFLKHMHPGIDTETRFLLFAILVNTIRIYFKD